MKWRKSNLKRISGLLRNQSTRRGFSYCWCSQSCYETKFQSYWLDFATVYQMWDFENTVKLKEGFNSEVMAPFFWRLLYPWIFWHYLERRRPIRLNVAFLWLKIIFHVIKLQKVSITSSPWFSRTLKALIMRDFVAKNCKMEMLPITMTVSNGVGIWNHGSSVSSNSNGTSAPG